MTVERPAPSRLIARLGAHPVRWALVLALCVRLAYVAVACVGTQFPRHRPFDCDSRPVAGVPWGNTPVIAVDVWTRGDGCHYLAIARDGYHPLPGSTSTAFFPLYPLLIRWAARLGGVSDVAAGLVLSNVLGFAAWALLARLAARRLPGPEAALALALFAAFPTRNFEMSVNTESLFLVLSVGAFWAYEQRRELTNPITTLLSGNEGPQAYLAVAGALWMLVVMVRRRAPVRDVVYVAASVAVPLSSGSMYSLARFVGVLFPVFFAAATELAPRPRARIAYWVVAAALAVWTAYRVGHGGAVV